MKNVLITGNSKGLGAELTNLYKSDNYNVIGLSSKDYDLAQDNSIWRFYLQHQNTEFDTVIINAATRDNATGKMYDPHSDAFERAYKVNCLSQIRLLHLLKDQVKSKVVIISSSGGTIYKNQKRPIDNYHFIMLGYQMSKAALNLAGVWFSRKLDVPVIMIDPGMMPTLIADSHLKSLGERTHPLEVAVKIKNITDNLTIKDTGKFLDKFGKEVPW